MKKFIYYFLCVQFGVFFLIGVFAALSGDTGGLVALLLGILGVWVSRKILLPVPFEVALNKAKKNLINPMEINSFSKESSISVSEIREKISKGKISSYEYERYLLIEADL